jgi:hypothetical protein
MHFPSISGFCVSMLDIISKVTEKDKNMKQLETPERNQG